MNKSDELTYCVHEGKVVFLRSEQAKELAQLQAAIRKAETWREFWPRIGEQRVASIEEIWNQHEIERPSDEAEFDPSLFPGFDDGDWPEWPEQEMLDLVPAPIQSRFGRVLDSVLNGPFVALDPSMAEEIVTELEAAGFHCTRDDALVMQACGWE